MSTADEKKSRFVKISPNETFVDLDCQRPLDEKRSAALAGDFQMFLVGTPVVSRRPDGKYATIDGQHRLAAAKAAGFGDTPILMQVFDGLTKHDEAALFLSLNGARKGVFALARYRVRLTAAEPVALEIESIAKASGLRIASNGRGCLKAIEAVEVAYHKGTLRKTLDVLVRWGGLDDPMALDRALVRGVSTFLHTYKDAETVHLAAAMKHFPARALIERLRLYTKNLGDRAEAERQVMFEVYNHRAPQKRRIEHYSRHTDAA